MVQGYAIHYNKWSSNSIRWKKKNTTQKKTGERKNRTIYGSVKHHNKLLFISVDCKIYFKWINKIGFYFFFFSIRWRFLCIFAWIAEVFHHFFFKIVFVRAKTISSFLLYVSKLSFSRHRHHHNIIERKLYNSLLRKKSRLKKREAN